ncbi:MAG: hypothetical protein QNK89_05315 [Lacinutrix sp.]|uniref:hypothetical protein n=1 Tax=Lacinutrix sp. TaxID=1937692 RepID=UPI00309EF060
MKKLLILALALFALQVTAQEKKEQHQLRKQKMEHMKDMEPKEMAELQTKKLTLTLDLTDEQQAKVEKLNLKNAELRKAGMEKRMAYLEAGKKPTKEEKLQMANDKLDQQIATKRAMKEILTEEQYKMFNKQSQLRRAKGAKQKI